MWRLLHSILQKRRETTRYNTEYLAITVFHDGSPECCLRFISAGHREVPSLNIAGILIDIIELSRWLSH